MVLTNVSFQAAQAPSDPVLKILLDYAHHQSLDMYLDHVEDNDIDIPVEQLLRWLLDMISSIEFIHKKNIIHRDIKPDNYFLFNDMSLKLGDFGISRREGMLAGSTLGSSAAGSPVYTAPEANNGEPEKASDIWSFGMSMIHLLTHESQAKSRLKEQLTVVWQDSGMEERFGGIGNEWMDCFHAVPFRSTVSNCLEEELISYARRWWN